jgi:sugar lactone lactonase YvrE
VIEGDCTSPVFLGRAGSASDQFNWPYSMVIRRGTPGGSDGVAFIADTKNNRVKAYDVEARTVIDVFGTRGSGTGQFILPAGIALSPGGRLFVADRGNKRIVELSFSGGNLGWVGTWGTGAGLLRPEGVAADTENIYVADTGKHRMVVLRLDTGAVRGTVTGTGVAGLDTPQSVSVDGNGCIYLSDTYNDRILVYRYGASCA